MARVVALVDDLFFQAKMLETAKHVGVSLECVTTGDALLDRVNSQPPALAAPALVVVDLNARCGGIDAVERLAPGNHLPVIAFLSHVQVELAERARRAGCCEVMPRSKFTQSLAEIFSRAKAQDAATIATPETSDEKA
jgi:CheY-like chemotaxis protein